MHGRVGLGQICATGAVSLLFALWLGAAGSTYYVDGASPTCSNSGPGTASVPYCSISAALGARAAADVTILVQPGTYREQVTVPASGSPSGPLVLQALGAVLIDGSDNLSSSSLWVRHASSNVWLAGSVSWSPKQVFVDGGRLTASSASVSSLPVGTFRYVSGTGLYVNVGGDNPGTRQAFVGRRLHGFRLAGRTWVTIDGFAIARTEDKGIYVSDSDNVTVQHCVVTHAFRQGISVVGSDAVRLTANRSTDNADHGLHLGSGTTGAIVEGNEAARNFRPSGGGNGLRMEASTVNLIQGNNLYDNQDSGVDLTSAANDNVFLQNRSWGNGDHGFGILDSNDGLFVGNVAWGNFKNGLFLQGASTGARVFDCILADNGLTTGAFDLNVDSGAKSGFSSNYNLFWSSGGRPPVRYDPTQYATVAAFATATGHEVRGLQSDPRFVDPQQGDFHLAPGSPAIDSATSSAPGWPAVDAEGSARQDDPSTPNTGAGTIAYADRGALEYQPFPGPPTARLIVTPALGIEPLSVTANASGSSDPGGVITSYLFDFGDGAVTGPQAGPMASHTYVEGQWTATVTVTDNDGQTDSASADVTVERGNQPPVAVLTVTPITGLAPLLVTASAAGSADPDGAIVSYQFNFGDGTVVGPQASPTATHTYAAGSWTATVTVQDNRGAMGSASAQVSAAFEQSPDEIHWTITGQTSVTFDWRGSPPDDSISYGTSPGVYTQTVPGYAPSPMPNSSTGPYWEARLTGLQEDTTYYYRIGDSAESTFRTPPPRGASGFWFAQLGDIGSSLVYEGVAPTQAQIAEDVPSLAGDDRPRFVLPTGDLTYGDQHGREAVDTHFNDVMVWSRWAAYMPAWGNHEDDDSPDNRGNYEGRFDFPNSQDSPSSPASGGPGEEWYWFDYGNVRFIAYPEPESGNWLDWRAKAGPIMDQAQADPAIAFIVTFGHRPAYSSGSDNGSDEALAEHLELLRVGRSKYVLNIGAHSHHYERSHPHLTDRILQIVSGGGGGTLGGLSSSRPSWSAFRMEHFQHLKVHVMEDRIEGYAVCGPDGGGNSDDCVMGEVIDSWTILSNTPPQGVIDSPAGDVTVLEGGSVTFAGTGSDPDGDLPLGYRWDFGPLASPNQSTLEDPGPVVFTEPGTYVVSFTVTDSRGLADPTPATRTVTVSNNLPPAAALVVTPPSGSPPLAVTANASGSVDQDGTIVSYRFNFGDGVTVGPQASPMAAHSYAEGSWTASVTVTDDDGAVGTASGLVTVTSLGANLVGNPSFESDTSGWVSYSSSTIARVAGGFDGSWALEVRGPSGTAQFGVNDSPSWVSSTPAVGTRYRISAWVRSVAGQGQVRLRIREYKGSSQVGSTTLSAPVTLTTAWQEVTMDYVTAGSASSLDLQVLDTPAASSERFLMDNVRMSIVPPPNQAPNGVIDQPAGAVTVAAGGSVSFAASGTDPDGNLPLSYQWDFGGGALARTVEDPGPVVFATAGVYTVTLTVKDARGLADPTPATRAVTVTNQAPSGVIDQPAGPVTVAAGGSVSFAASGTDPDGNLPLSYQWDFGGGAPARTVEDPGPVVFSTAGVYTVTLTVRDGLGLADPTPATRTVTVAANQAPNSVIDQPAGPVTVAAGGSVSFAASGSDPDGHLPLSYQWSFGGGAPAQTVEDPGPVVFSTAGVYTVTLTVRDGLGLADPTPATRTVTVAVNQAPNGVIDQPAGAVTVTAGGSVSFAASGTDPDGHLPLSYQWSFGGGAPAQSVEDPGPVVFATAGVYTVTLTVRDGLGLADPTPATRTVTVAVNQAPNGVIDQPAGPVTVAAGGSVSFAASGSDPDGHLPLSYQWDFGGGAPPRTVEDPGPVVFSTAGVYTVTLTVRDGLGLADPTPATRTVTVTNQAPNGVIDQPAGPVTVTAGGSVSFAASGSDPDGHLPLSYQWDFGGGAPARSVEDPGPVVFSTAGVYTVTLTVRDGLGLADPTPATRAVTVLNLGPNLVGNPSFESDTSGWSSYSSSTIARVAGGFDGSWALEVRGPSGTAMFGANDSPSWVSSTPAVGTRYRISAWVRSVAGQGQVRLRIREYKGSSQVGSTTLSAPVTLTTAWQEVTMDYVTAGSASSLDLQVLDTPAASAERFLLDAVSMRVVP